MIRQPDRAGVAEAGFDIATRIKTAPRSDRIEVQMLTRHIN